MQGFYPNWMSESSLIRQLVPNVDHIMGARHVLVDVEAAAIDGGYGGGTGTEIVYVGGTGTGDATPPKIVYKDRPWPVVLIRRILTKEEEEIDVILVNIKELKV